jgi:hypothetical protein
LRLTLRAYASSASGFLRDWACPARLVESGGGAEGAGELAAHLPIQP